MALKDIFTMVKADRYTADGCEVLNKAREADVEDRRYNIGEISEKTGLQKTANGWVKPKSGGAAKGTEKSGSQLNKNWTKEDVITSMPEGWKRVEGATTAPNGYVIVSNNKSRLGGERETKLIKQEDFEKSTASSEVPKMTPEQRKKWEDKAANSSETTASLRNQIKAFEKDPVTNPHSKEIVDIYKKELAKRENDPNYRPEKVYSDTPPRVLTGDTRIRVRKA